MDMKTALAHWPATLEGCDVEKWGLDKTSFLPVVVTIDRAFDGERYGLKFVGDDTPSGRTNENTGEQYLGVIWSISGPWNEATKKRDPYQGHKYQAGDQVRVGLTIRTGDSRDFYDVAFVSDVTQAPAAQPPATPDAASGDHTTGSGTQPASADASKVFATPAGDYYLTPKDYHYVDGVTGSQERDRRVTAWNGLTAMLAVQIGNPSVEAFWNEELFRQRLDDWEDGYEALKAGRVPFVDDEATREGCCGHPESVHHEQPNGTGCQTCYQSGKQSYLHPFRGETHESGWVSSEPPEPDYSTAKVVQREPEHESGSAPPEEDVEEFDWDRVEGT